MLSLQSFLREGRVVGPCWEKLKPKGPKGRVASFTRVQLTGAIDGYRAFESRAGLLRACEGPFLYPWIPPPRPGRLE